MVVDVVGHSDLGRAKEAKHKQSERRLQLVTTQNVLIRLNGE